MLSEPGTRPRVRRLVGCVRSWAQPCWGCGRCADGVKGLPRGAGGSSASLKAWWATVHMWTLPAPVLLFSSWGFFHLLWHQVEEPPGSSSQDDVFLRLGVDMVALSALGFPGSNIWLPQCSPFWCAGASTRYVGSQLQSTMQCAYRTGSTSWLRCFIILFRDFLMLIVVSVSHLSGA